MLFKQIATDFYLLDFPKFSTRFINQGHLVKLEQYHEYGLHGVTLQLIGHVLSDKTQVPVVGGKG